MIIELSTDFTEAEKTLLAEYSREYDDIDIKLYIDTDKLIYEAPNIREKMNEPHRIICIGGYYLLEEKDDLNVWYMGTRLKDNQYVFWASYGDFANILESL